MKVALSSAGKIILELEVWEATLLHHVTTRVPNPWNDLYMRALQQAQGQGVWKLIPVEDGPQDTHAAAATSPHNPRRRRVRVGRKPRV